MVLINYRYHCHCDRQIIAQELSYHPLVTYIPGYSAASLYTLVTCHSTELAIESDTIGYSGPTHCAVTSTMAASYNSTTPGVKTAPHPTEKQLKQTLKNTKVLSYGHTYTIMVN